MRALHLSLLTVLALVACEGDFEGETFIECPDDIQFKAVSPLLEKRCGSLDCHGSIARPLKIYGKNGLRRDPSAVSGEGDTSPDELAENRRSVCGLEPETLNEVVSTDPEADPRTLEPRDLLLLRKPLLIERHKGGQLLLKGGAGDNCIESWLLGDVNQAECDLAVSQP